MRLQLGFEALENSTDYQKHVGNHEKRSDGNNEPANVLIRLALHKRGMHLIGSIVGEACHQYSYCEQCNLIEKLQTVKETFFHGRVPNLVDQKTDAHCLCQNQLESLMSLQEYYHSCQN